MQKEKMVTLFSVSFNSSQFKFNLFYSWSVQYVQIVHFLKNFSRSDYDIDVSDRDCSDGEVGSKDSTTGLTYCQSRCQQYPTCYDMQVPMEHAAVS